jgi:hypothetical protein
MLHVANKIDMTARMTITFFSFVGVDIDFRRGSTTVEATEGDLRRDVKSLTENKG